MAKEGVPIDKNPSVLQDPSRDADGRAVEDEKVELERAKDIGECFEEGQSRVWAISFSLEKDGDIHVGKGVRGSARETPEQVREPDLFPFVQERGSRWEAFEQGSLPSFSGDHVPFATDGEDEARPRGGDRADELAADRGHEHVQRAASRRRGLSPHPAGQGIAGDRRAPGSQELLQHPRLAQRE